MSKSTALSSFRGILSTDYVIEQHSEYKDDLCAGWTLLIPNDFAPYCPHVHLWLRDDGECSWLEFEEAKGEVRR